MMSLQRLITPLTALTVFAAPLAPRHYATALPPFRFQYAAKLVCGAARDTLGPVALQTYGTTINVNNPGDSTVKFRKWLVIGYPPGLQSPAPPMKPIADSLLARWALATYCYDLTKRYGLKPVFFEGFVVIQSTMALDVVGVYTVPGGVDVVPAPVRQIYVPQ